MLCNSVSRNFLCWKRDENEKLLLTTTFSIVCWYAQCPVHIPKSAFHLYAVYLFEFELANELTITTSKRETTFCCGIGILAPRNTTADISNGILNYCGLLL